MEIIIKAIFVLTAFISVMSLFKIFALIAGNTVRLWVIGKWYLQYPSMLYQIWYWSDVIIW